MRVCWGNDDRTHLRQGCVSVGRTVSGAPDRYSLAVLIVPLDDRYLTQTEQSSMQGGDQPDRRRMAFLGSQALLVAGQRPFRRPGLFVLGLLDVLAMRWRCGFLRWPRPPSTPTGGCHSRTATVGEQFGHLRRVDVLQRRVAPARSVVAVHEQGAHTLDA